MNHPIKEPNDKRLHFVNNAYYVEFMDGHLEPIQLATHDETDLLIREMFKTVRLDLKTMELSELPEEK